MAEINPTFGDREIMDDLLASQQQMTAAYNTAANQCASGALQSSLMTLLGEEHQLRMELFQEMQRRGWRPTEQAPKERLQQAKERFTGTDS